MCFFLIKNWFSNYSRQLLNLIFLRFQPVKRVFDSPWFESSIFGRTLRGTLGHEELFEKAVLENSLVGIDESEQEHGIRIVRLLKPFLCPLMVTPLFCEFTAEIGEIHFVHIRNVFIGHRFLGQEQGIGKPVHVGKALGYIMPLDPSVWLTGQDEHVSTKPRFFMLCIPFIMEDIKLFV